jgi:hypothetical protein
MAPRVSTNSSMQLTNSYVSLFHVAQYNLTLWLMEENADKMKKKQKHMSKIHADHRDPVR